MPHITQIAALNVESGAELNVYVQPKVPITQEASTITGITYEDGIFKTNGNCVEALPVTLALDKLNSWLGKYRNVCLVAHNGRRFDFPILVSTLRSVGVLDKFPVGAFVDTMSVFRKLYPKTSLKQVDLVQSLIGTTYEAHNAMADVVALGKLVKFANLPQKEFMSHSFLPSAVANNLLFNSAKSENIESLNVLMYRGICKRPTAENIAGSGLKLCHLRVIYKRSGEDGLRDVLTSKNSEGFPRVTNCKKVLDEVIPKLVQYFTAD